MGRDERVNSAINSFQALVTQVQACGHCPPNLWVVLLTENQPHGVICAQRSPMEGEGPCFLLKPMESYSEQLNTKAANSPHRMK